MESTTITTIIPILTATPNETTKWETSTVLTVTTVPTEQEHVMRTPIMAWVATGRAIVGGYHYNHDQNTNYQSDDA